MVTKIGSSVKLNVIYRCDMRTITVDPYDPKWAEEFEKIKNEILPVISDCIIS